MRKAAHGDARETRSGATLEAGAFPQPRSPGHPGTAYSIQAWTRILGSMAAILFPEGRQRRTIPRFSGADTRIKSGISAFDAPMHGWTWGRAERGEAELDSRKTEKKRSSQASWKTCRLGTPFPRSALFLLTSLLKTRT